MQEDLFSLDPKIKPKSLLVVLILFLLGSVAVLLGMTLKNEFNNASPQTKTIGNTISKTQIKTKATVSSKVAAKSKTVKKHKKTALLKPVVHKRSDHKVKYTKVNTRSPALDKLVKQARKKASFFKQTVTISGVKREYYVYIPKSVPKGVKAPAVIAFHGFESDAHGLRWLIKPDKWAEKYGYIMIYPNAIKKSWNAGKGFGNRNKNTDDLSFAAALPDVITARHPVDKNRIYVMGFSNGAQMSTLMTCKLSHKITAAGIVAHSMNIPQCNPKYKVPVAVIHGAKDKLAPYNGGGKHKLSSHKETINFYQSVNKTLRQPKVIVNKKTIKCTEDVDAQGKTAVTACTAFDAGHSWPGGVEFKTKLFGKTNKELIANDFLFSFFDRFRSKPPSRDNAKLVMIKSIRQPQKKLPSFKLKYHELKVGKHKRSYQLLLPDISEPLYNQAVHIVFVPQKFSPQQLVPLLEAKRMGEIHRSVFAFPKGDWTQGKQQDLKFIADMVHAIRRQYVPDSRDVYVLAFSDGGHIAQSLYCQSPQLISAFAFVAYSWRKGKCQPVMLPPVMLVHSKADNRHPYHGNDEKKLLSFKQTVTQFKGRIDDLVQRRYLIKKKDHRCERWQDRNHFFELLTCTTDWGGNTVPGSKGEYPQDYGKTMPTLKGMHLLMSFFAQHQHHEYGVIRHR